MSDQAPDPSDTGGPRPRPTATIDLTATEVHTDPATSTHEAERVEAAAEELKAQAGAEGPPARAAETASAEEAVEAAAPGRPDTMQGDASPAAASDSAAAAQGLRWSHPGDEPSEPPAPTAESSKTTAIPPMPPPRRGGRWSHAGAGAIGGIAVLLVLLGLWATGTWPPQTDEGTNQLRARMAMLESQLRDLSARPVTASVDPKALQDLSNRLAKLEAAVASARSGNAGGPTTDPALAERVAAAEAASKALAADMADLRRRTEEIAGAATQAAKAADAAARAAAAAQSAAQTAAQTAARGGGVDRKDLEAVAARVAALEQASRSGADQITGSLRAAHYAVAAVALRGAVDRNVPFATELGVIKAFVAADVDLTPLETFAAAGIPRPFAFNRELTDLGPEMLRIAQPDEHHEGGFLDRLQANAERLVRIRRVDDAPGDDPAAIIGRIEARGIRMDVSELLAELAKLPPAVRAPAEGWIKKAQVRVAAIELSRRIEADALTALRGQEH